MVIAAIACDTRARLAPVCGLSPYADEIITVLSPNGIAFAQSAAKTISLSVFKSLNAFLNGIDELSYYDFDKMPVVRNAGEQK